MIDLININIHNFRKQTNRGEIGACVKRMAAKELDCTIKLRNIVLDCQT